MVLLRTSVSINPTLTMEIELLCRIHHPQKTFQGIFPGALLLNYAKQVVVMSIKFQIPDKHSILWYTFKIQRLTHTLRLPLKICLGVQTVDIRHREVIPKFLYWRHRCFQKEFCTVIAIWDLLEGTNCGYQDIRRNPQYPHWRRRCFEKVLLLSRHSSFSCIKCAR